MKEILQNGKPKQVKFDCVQAPFESKDLLKASGFSRGGASIFWTRLVVKSELDAMKEFLTNKIYPKGRMNEQFPPIYVWNRFKVN